jgi:hypothetical protein
LSVKAGGVALKEITVITDVRMSPDSPDLILVRHPISVVDGELQLVGEPSESKISLLLRRVITSVKWATDPRTVGAIVAEVKNEGFTPVETTSVVFLSHKPIVPGNGIGTEKKGQEWHWTGQMFPKNRGDSSLLLPGESEEWELPINTAPPQVRALAEIAPEKYKLVVLSGKHPISEVTGQQLRPLFAEMEEAREPLISDALRMVLLSLPVEIRDKLDRSLKYLSVIPVDRWNKVHVSGLEKLEDSLYLLALPPDYRVLLRRHRRGRIEVIDVARTPDRQPAAANG